MTHIGGSSTTYYYNTTMNNHGDYNMFIWANDTSNNQNTSTPNNYIKPPNYEINQGIDRTINILDLNAVALKFGTTGLTPGSIREDTNNDGNINILDLNDVALHFGQTW